MKVSNRSKSRDESWTVERVGRDEAVDAQPALEVHLAGEPTTDLDGLEFTFERPRERPVDHPLEAPFELLESHAGVSLPVATPR